MPSSSLKALDELLISKEFMEDPYPILRQLREEDPVHWSDSIGGWILTRYDDMVTTFKDMSHFSNEGRLAKAVEYLPAESRAEFKAFEDYYRQKESDSFRSSRSHPLSRVGHQGFHSPRRGSPCGPACRQL